MQETTILQECDSPFIVKFYKTSCGTRADIAPEVILNRGQGISADF